MWLRAQNKSLVNLDNIIGLNIGVTGEQGNVFVFTTSGRFPIYTAAGGNRREAALRVECQRVVDSVYKAMCSGVRLMELEAPKQEE